MLLDATKVPDLYLHFARRIFASSVREHIIRNTVWTL